jgi:hypothetical protein
MKIIKNGLNLGYTLDFIGITILQSGGSDTGAFQFK